MRNDASSINRREFLVHSAAAIATTSAVASVGFQTKEARGDQTVSGKTEPIMVHHEWGKLKEVVCGIPYFKIPSSLPKAAYNYTPTKGIEFIEANPGKTLEEADPETYAKVVEQMNGAVSILVGRGVKVHRPLAVDDAEAAYLENLFPVSAIQFFPRDPMLVIGNRFIETELYFPVRRRERFGIRRSVADRLSKSDAQTVSMPPAVPTPEQKDGSWGPGPFLEGGDVFLLGHDIYVGVSGNASNTAGVKWLQQYLGETYRVHEIKLTKKFLHLDCCLATPRPGLAIICREAFVGGIPDFLKGWTLVDVPFKDAKEKLGCNGLVLDEKSIIIASGLDYLAEGLRKAGQEVIETPFDAVYQYAGAFRCWHHPLIRQSTL